MAARVFSDVLGGLWTVEIVPGALPHRRTHEEIAFRNSGGESHRTLVPVGKVGLMSEEQLRQLLMEIRARTR